MYIKSPRLLLVCLTFAVMNGCTNRTDADLVNCDTNRVMIVVSSQTDPTNCSSNNGSITVEAIFGTPPYQFRINQGGYQASPNFLNLGGGLFALDVKDFNGCESGLTTSLKIASSDLSATADLKPDTDCTTGNGSITIKASGSNMPFQYKIGEGNFGSANTFEALKTGPHTVTVRDAGGCTLSLSVTVARGQTDIRYSTDVKSIIETNCAVTGCHVSGSQNPNLSVFANIKSNADQIRTRTSSRSMPPSGRSLSQEQIAKIACWVNDGAPDN